MPLTQQAEAFITLVGEDKVSALVEKVQNDLLDVGKRTRKAADETGGLEDRWAKVAVGVDAVVNIIQRGIGMAQQFANAAQRAGIREAVGQEFARDVDDAATAMNRLRDAVSRTLTDTSLQQFAIQARQAGLSAREFERVVEVAAKLAASGRGAARGIVTTAGALEELMDSIVGASDSNLEKFGIIFDMPEATKRFADEMGIAKDKIDKAVQSQAVLRRVTEELSNLEAISVDESAITNAQRVETAWVKIKEAAEDVAGSTLRAGAAVSDLADIQALSTTQVGFLLIDAAARDAAKAADDISQKIAEDLVRAHVEHARAAVDSVIAIGNLTGAFTILDQQLRKTFLESPALREFARIADLVRSDFLGRTQFSLGRRGGGRAGRSGLRGRGQRPLSIADEFLPALDANIRADAQFQGMVAGQARVQAALDESIEKARMQRGTLDGMADAQERVARSSMDMAASFAQGFGGAAGAVANASQIIVSQVDQITDTIKKFEKAGLSSSDAFKASVPGMLAASGQLVAGFIDDQRAQAAVLAIMETAAGIASIFLNPAAAAAHFAAAGLYTLVAAGAIGNSGGRGAGGGGGGRSRPPALPAQVGPQPQQTSERGTAINVFVQGGTIIGSNRRQAGKDMAELIAEALRNQSGGSSPTDFFPR